VTRIIFLGPPGAGKGTQASKIASIQDIPHISTGAILRDSVTHATELGIKAKSYMDRGELVPDQLMLDLVSNRLCQPDAQPGWILDGFPRTVAQARFLEDLLTRMTQVCDCVINLDVPDDILIDRLLKRGRADDTEETIRTRLEVYRQQTAPLIEFYHDRQKLITVNGNQPVEKVTEDLNAVVQPGH
jgi:adenylate kinase